MWELKEDGTLIVVEESLLNTLRDDRCCLCNEKACYFIFEEEEEICLCNDHYWSTK